MPPSADPFALDPARSALLVVDMQNDLVREGAPQEVPQARLVIGTIAALIVAFRGSDRPVVFTHRGTAANPAVDMVARGWR